jgi:hypothetical protein
MSDKTYTGRCFCGAVELTVTGAPAGMGYCHCASCRSWGAAPVNGFTLWKTDTVTERSRRQWCKSCGGHVMSAHPHWDLIDVFAATIPDFPFDPQVHVNYGETVLRMNDGKPKFKDLPAEMGGSGEQVNE